MTDEQRAPTSRGMSLVSVVAGLVSIALLVALFLVNPIVRPLLLASIAAGLVGVVLGILALRKRQLRGAAVAGLVLSSLGFAASTLMLLFALAFAYGNSVYSFFS